MKKDLKHILIIVAVLFTASFCFAQQAKTKKTKSVVAINIDSVLTISAGKKNYLCINLKPFILRRELIQIISEVVLFIRFTLRMDRFSQEFNHQIIIIIMASGIHGHIHSLKAILLISGISKVTRELFALQNSLHKPVIRIC